MNKLDLDYLSLLKDIKENGSIKKDRTGTGTISLFGKEIRHQMKDGFPLLTTKKMYIPGIIEELIWFMKGGTNIRDLILKNCNIWNADAFKKYKQHVGFSSNPHDRHITSVKDSKEWEGMGEYVIGADFTYEEFIEKIKTDENFAQRWGDLGRVYGAQWRGWKSYIKYNGSEKYKEYSPEVMKLLIQPIQVDQLSNLINDLKNNPDSRRLMVNSWKVDELDSMTLPPCHYHFQCYTRELSLAERVKLYRAEVPYNYTEDLEIMTIVIDDLDKIGIPTRALSLAWNQRSVDVGLGLGFNIASYGFLLTILAKIVNMIPEQLIGFFGDTHIYKNHIEGINEQMKREPYDLPSLELRGVFDKINDYWVNDKFQLDEFLSILSKDDFIINNYKSHPKLFLPLSN